MKNNRGRKKKVLSYDIPFASQLRKLLTDTKTTQPMLAEAIGVSRQAIGQWKDGNTLPDIVSLGKIADYFNVSADYLLGRTSVKTTDIDLKSVCEYIGLSENAVTKIRSAISKDVKSSVLYEGIIVDILDYIDKLKGETYET